MSRIRTSAAPLAIVAYFGAYGPAPIEAFGDWLAGGWFGKRRLRAWVESLGDRLVEIDVEGDRAYALAERPRRPGRGEADARRSGCCPGFDQYVLGPGTADGHVVPAPRRAAVSRQSGWISPVVVSGGTVSGTWELDGDQVRVAWFSEASRPPGDALGVEVARLAELLGRDLRPTISRV